MSMNMKNIEIMELLNNKPSAFFLSNAVFSFFLLFLYVEPGGVGSL